MGSLKGVSREKGINLHETDADEAESSPYEEDLGAQVGVVRVDHVGSRVGNGPVQQPVAGSGHGQALGASLERVQFTCYNPCDWTPRAGEEEDVDAHKGDGGSLGGQIGGSGYGSGDGDDVLTHAHTDTSQQEEVTAAETLNHPQSS